MLVGSPLPPVTDGKLPNSRLLATKSGLSVFIDPYTHEPCSIIAALPVYSSAWSALVSAAIEEKPLMNPFAFTRSWILVQASITAGSDQAFALLAKIAANTSGPPTRSRRYSSHIIEVHFD